MEPTTINGHTFDEWVELYKRDPLEFKHKTRITLSESFDSIKDEEQRIKLQQLQFRIDNELRHYKNPIAKMNKMIEIFWDGFRELQQAVNTLETTLHAPQLEHEEKQNAKVVLFKKD